MGVLWSIQDGCVIIMTSLLFTLKNFKRNIHNINLYRLFFILMNYLNYLNFLLCYCLSNGHISTSVT